MEKEHSPDAEINPVYFTDENTFPTIILDDKKIKVLPDSILERFLTFTLSSFQQGRLQRPKGGENDRCS